MKPRVLLVEDERHIAQGLVFNLEAEGYSVVHAETGEDALAQLDRDNFTLVVLDLMLPGISGYEVCQTLRKSHPRLPVLILSARSEEQDRIKGLELGADDYLSKPFSLEEFLLRIKGMLKRSEWYRPAKRRELQFGTNRVDLTEGRASTVNGEILLTEQELKLLQAFAEREGRLVERAELLKAAWDMSPDAETRTLDNFIVRLRKYFEPDPAAPQHFLTVRGRGYRFVGKP